MRARAASRAELCPNGLTVHYVSRPDVAFLYDEVFVQHTYTSHGVVLKPGDTVFDVGANIGVFALQAASLVSPGGTVICAEPAPEAYAALCDTLAANSTLCDSVDIRPLNVALGAGSASTALLTTYPQAAGWSTLCVDDAETATNVTAYAQLVPLASVVATAPASLRLLLPLLAPLRSTRLYAAAAEHIGRRMLRGSKVVPCTLFRLSQLLDACIAHVPGFSGVALLKIDVERAELDVLRGIESREQWARIQQVVAEVHDIDGRLDAIIALLSSPLAGFTHVQSAQPASLRGSNLHVVYATRLC